MIYNRYNLAAKLLKIIYLYVEFQKKSWKMIQYSNKRITFAVYK